MRCVKGRLLLCIGSIIAIILLICIEELNLFRDQIGYLRVEPGKSVIFFDEYNLKVEGYDKDGATFFFLPSYIDVKRLSQEKSEYKIRSMEGDELAKPEVNQIQDVLVCAPDGSFTPWKFGLFQTDNLYTINISVMGMDYYEVEHDNYSNASMTMHSPRGKITYFEDSALIKGRGNASWGQEADEIKRPFQIKLPRKTSFCGMKSSDKWALIKDDETGLHNKIVFDLAADMGMEYAIESDWVDLYINDEYMGIYLLCHEPRIGRGDLNIGNLTAYNALKMSDDTIVETDTLKGYDYSLGHVSVPQGGYLIENNMITRYYKKKCGFKFGNYMFTIKSPKNACIDEVAYIRDFVCEVDNTIHDDSSKRVSMIDENSFARQYLISEISLEPDTALTSYYFYKKPNEDILYAGPCWDFDGAFGEWSGCRDYTASIFDINQFRIEDSGAIPLDWDRCLLENDEYREYIRTVFCENISIFERLLSSGIDKYHNKIYRSLCMDYLRWNGSEDYPEKLDNKYKYLEFFLFNRFKYLSERFNAEISIEEPDIYDDTSHVLEFIYEDGTIAEMIVKDGEQVRTDEMPVFDTAKYTGWKVLEDGKVHGYFSYFDPVFEDKTLVLADYDEEGFD